MIAANGMRSRCIWSLKLKVTAEALLVDREVPELVLQDDGHVGRVAVAQELRDRHARMMGAEGDVEMMRRRRTFLGEAAQHVAHDGAQRTLDQPSVVYP